MKTFFSLAFALALIAALGGIVGSASARPGGWNAQECVIDEGYNRYSTCNTGG